MAFRLMRAPELVMTDNGKPKPRNLLRDLALVH